MTADFAKEIPKTIILDATEQPSSYKHKNTLKTMVGITLVLSHLFQVVSSSYGESTSDWQITERSYWLNPI